MLGDDNIKPTGKNFYWYNQNPQAYLILLKDLLASMNPQDQTKIEQRSAIQQFIKIAEDLENHLNFEQTDKLPRDEENKKQFEQLDEINQKLSSQQIRLRSEFANIVDVRGNISYVFENIYQNIYNPLIQKFKKENTNIKDVNGLQIQVKGNNYSMVNQMKFFDKNVLIMKVVKNMLLVEKSYIQREKKQVSERIINYFEKQSSGLLKYINRKLNSKQNCLEELDKFEQRIKSLENEQNQVNSVLQKRAIRMSLYNEYLYLKNKLDNDSQISTSEEDRKEAQKAPIIKAAAFQRKTQVVLLKEQPNKIIWIILAVWLLFIFAGGLFVYIS